jgi:diaminohydroxyphosphoribosylaminopyrimidine deaminase/5-amino-6-(5-phosphoribosylamino)uracil reductase
MASEQMSRALALAAQAEHRTSPNPMVGAVLVGDDGVLGEGYHRLAGELHAEAAALAAAGARARGATVYVTLEPCSHQGRTPPCADALVSAGVRRVVAATEDPDPRVRGEGVARLRAAGIEVEVGDGADQAEALNRRWLAARRQGRPVLALKFAMTLDGKIATRSRQSRWITGEAARLEAHRLRQAYDAVAVGAGTVIEDDPELTARLPDGTPATRQPLRVVVDGALRLRPGARILDPSLPGRTLVATTARALRERGGELRDSGAWVEAFDEQGAIPVPDLLALLARNGASSVLIEGGGELAWSAVRSGLVDHVYAFVAPRLVGGASAPTAVGGEGFAELDQALRLELTSVHRLGEDVLIEAVPS